MIKITVRDLIDNCEGKLLIGSTKEEIKECFISSKQKTNNGTFFGLKGNNIDGSMFYKEAFNNGAKICVLSKMMDLDLNGYDDKTVIICKDPLNTLKQLAAYKRSLFKGDVISITGSVGKTTCKEILSSVLEKKYRVLKTLGNQNSQIGLPLSILRLTNEEVVILEMGMSRIGEIHNLSLIAKPTISIITNVLTSHIGNLKTRQNILNAKLEILDGMNNGILIINNDNDLLSNLKISNNRLITYGINNKSDINATDIVEDKITMFNASDIKDLKVRGSRDFIYNALPSIIIGKKMGISDELIKYGINDLNPIKHRLELIKIANNITIIDDTYNASYESVLAALDYIKYYEGRKIVILGDILELGKYSKKIHKKISGKLNNIDKLITVGKYSKYIRGRKHKHFKNELRTRKYVKNIIKPNDVILIKGSNGINLYKIVEYLKLNF